MQLQKDKGAKAPHQKKGTKPKCIYEEDKIMPINLSKGQKVSLTKGNPGLKNIMIGLGWDVNAFDSGADFDLDAACFMADDSGRCPSEREFIFYGNLEHSSGAVKHMGDNLTGGGDGDDEQIVIDLAAIPPQYDRIVIVVNIYQAIERKQHFGMIQNAFARIVDQRTNQELCKYNLTDNYSGQLALIFGEVYRHNGEWKFNAIGQGTQDPGIGELAGRFR